MAPSLVSLIWYYLSGNLEELRLKPGDRLDSGSRRVFLVRRGTGQVLRDGPGGHDILLRVVREGAIVSDGETLMAETLLDLLALPAISRRDRAEG